MVPDPLGVQVIVGTNEISRERLIHQLIDDIMAHLSRLSKANRREVLLGVIGKLQRGEIQLVHRICGRPKTSQPISIDPAK